MSKVPHFLEDLEEVKRSLSLLAGELRNHKQARAEEHKQSEELRAVTEGHLRRDIAAAISAGLKPMIDENAAAAQQTAVILRELQLKLEAIERLGAQPKTNGSQRKPTAMSRLRRLFGKEKP